MMIRSTMLAACIIAVSNPAWCAKAQDIDANKDGVISVAEYTRYEMDEVSPPLSSMDKDGDGVLSPAEVAIANRALASVAEMVMRKVTLYKVDAPDGLSTTEFATRFDTEDKDELLRPGHKGKSRINLMIRENHEQVTQTVRAKHVSKAKAATLSYTRDQETNNETIVLRGTIMAPYTSQRNANLLVVPSLSINKVKNQNVESREVDSVEFRYGLNWEKTRKKGGVYYLRLNPLWTTDTDFNLDVRGLEAQYDLEQRQVMYWGGTPIGSRFRTIFHSEYGTVEDADGRQDLTEGETFLRAGVKVTGLFRVRGYEEFSVTIDWEYLKSISGDLRDRKLFQSKLGYDLDDQGHYTLEASFLNGDRTIALEDEEIWTIGLGVKF